MQGFRLSEWPRLTWKDQNGFGHCESGYLSKSRVYCASCGARKGSDKCYYPESQCRKCGSLETIVRDESGAELPWKTWLKVKDHGQDRKRARVQRRSEKIAAD